MGYKEHRTTTALLARLREIGLDPQVLPGGTGLICDIRGGEGPMVALRADIDALPQHDTKNVAYRSTVEGVAHACGHDVHTTMLLGAGHYLSMLADSGFPGTVRLIFQPAEEVPGGARDVITAGGLTGVERIFALHCDPAEEVGFLGLRTGAITASYDKIRVEVTGPGGHTARPYLTADLVTAIAAMAKDVPAALAREIDPRIGHVLAFGHISAGTAANSIPTTGLLEGSLRLLDLAEVPSVIEKLRRLVAAVAATYKVEATLLTSVGLPPTVNEATSVEIFRDSGIRALGEVKDGSTGQSLGGEDFGYYTVETKGALARFGVRTPGMPKYDLHKGGFDVDEDCIALGVRLWVATALRALHW
ncbi:amidohydrolase [Actinomadura violacea]|uniref:amidohydrolase n=1 Tax=Actinomadura violacea TaxID=2819934 RepID=UPI0027DAFFDA|nr:amidohydrolase [Actinomadura violacea]